MLNSEGFDSFIDEYDGLTSTSDKNNTYPFAGYSKVLDKIYNAIVQTPNSTVLDLGFGTGKLTRRLYDYGCTIYGQDFSKKMVELAKKSMPNGHFYQADFANGLQEALTHQKYDYIVATYALHHLSDEQKTELISKLLNNLKENGKILIGDISFENRNLLNQCKEVAGNEWDDEETYCVADELKKVFPNLQFTAESFCGGVFVIAK